MCALALRPHLWLLRQRPPPAAGRHAAPARRRCAHPQRWLALAVERWRWRQAGAHPPAPSSPPCPARAGPALAIAGAHGTAVNVLRWSPASEHLVLSASHDPAILVHDLRRAAEPLHRLAGHAPGGGTARIAGIYQPCFVGGGDAIATPCERSTLLSLYSARTGATISRGEVGLALGATCCGTARGDALLASGARAVYAFAPSWHTPLPL